MIAGSRPWWKRAFVWEIPFLAILGAFMLWVRMLPYKALVGGARAYFIGTDPFYHYRTTLGAVRAFPRVPRWDPWTFYPNGTGTGQFGTLFDWLVAAYVVVTQGKDASELYVQQVLGAYPAVLGALLIVPFYLVAKQLLGIPGAVVASIALALLPGEFLIRSIASYSDHHVAEALFVCVSMLGVYVAATKGHAFRDAIARWREPRGYASAIAFGVLGGVALAANVYVWPPALLFMGVLTVWLTIVILLEDGKGGDASGYAFGGSVAFVTAGLLVAPAVETTFLGEFNTYGLLHVVAPILAAAWIWIVHLTSRATRSRGWSPWVVPGIIAALGVLGFVIVQTALAATYSSFAWGLSWVTGIGVQRTTLTIAEARKAAFFCANDTRELSCLGTDFGAAAPVSALILIVLFVFVLVKRRRQDILLLLWSLVVFRATQTQIRFSYYAALNIALLLGWLAARVAEWIGLEAALAGEPARKTPVSSQKGRKTRRVEATAKSVQPWQLAAVAAVLLLILPGNVIATDNAQPGWRSAAIGAPDGDLVLWLDGLDWMRQHTPAAGVDLGVVVARPPAGALYAYPPETYGVLSWWDYGHWIETVAQRPPVANPFQQAAPFASLYFTERDPAQAEAMLDAWVQGKGPVRYVWIDDAMATGKYGAITVWANSQNASRARWADGAYLEQQSYQTGQGGVSLYSTGPEYDESMMGRLYDDDANGLSHYRLVYEHGDYVPIGNVADSSNGNIRCLHDVVGSRACPIGISSGQVNAYQPGTAVLVGDAFAYDLRPVSRLKLFERVEGARLVGVAAPGERVTATVRVVVEQPNETGVPQAVRSFGHEVSTIAGPDGRFEIVFPYATSEPLGAAGGGTDAIARGVGPVVVATATREAGVEIPERAVLDGLEIAVALPPP